MKGLKCWTQVHGRNFWQEWYDTSSGDARKRAGQCRTLGFKVFTETSRQVTPQGLVNMTLLNIVRTEAQPDYRNIPIVAVQTVSG